MVKRFFSLISAIIVPFAAVSGESGEKIPDGWLLWHSYSDYSALDSRLFLRAPDGEVTEITGDFVHPMNGSFGSSPADVTFMAIDTAADEWDIYLYNIISGETKNLTEKSGFRNEDPKFSPDGRQIVFKRGRWDSAADDFRYDLALLELDSGDVRMLTDDPDEEAMPCFSADGAYIYYANYRGGTSDIRRLELANGRTETVFAEEGVSAYYPVVCGESVFFTKQYSADNRNDMIIRLDGDVPADMPFDSADFNCSDPCPAGEHGMIYSSTAAGSYDLCFFDGAASYPLKSLNTAKNELGAAFYPGERMAGYAVGLCKAVLGESGFSAGYDLNGDGRTDCFDMVFARKLLEKQITNCNK